MFRRLGSRKKPAQLEIPPTRVGFVIDNQLVDILHLEDRLAAVMLSKPVIVDLTEDVTKMIKVGATYNPEDGSFELK